MQMGKKYNGKRIKKDIPNLQELEKELRRERYNRRFRRILKRTVDALIVVAAVAAIIATLVFPVLQIAGTSMEPNLNDGDIVLLAKTDKLETGDLCAFYYSNKILIKRVIPPPEIICGSRTTAPSLSTVRNWTSRISRKRLWANATSNSPIKFLKMPFL